MGSEASVLFISLMKRIKFFLTLLLISTLSLVSCRMLPPVSSSCQANTASVSAFSKWCENVFTDEISQNTLNLHYTLKNPQDYGIRYKTISLGSFDTLSQEKYLNRIQDYLTTLKSFDYTSLSLDEQLTYDILQYDFLQTLNNKSYYLYSEPLSSVTGIQAQLPILLSEYSFYHISDISVYLKLLSQVEDYYHSIIDFEKEKAKIGLFMPEQSADAIIAQCEDFLKNPSENMLLTTFKERLSKIETLDSRAALEYETENMKIFYGKVIPAYENLISALTELKSNSKNQNGLCYLPKGREYYEALVQETTGSDKTIPELKTFIKTYYTADLLSLKKYLEINENATKASVDFSNINPERILSYLQTQISNDFPTPPDIDYQVKYVSTNLSEHISPAFYLTPPIDAPAENVIYINPSSKLETLSLFTTLAHEGYPGHLYQTVYSTQNSSSPIRSILNFGGYTEGWATYAEMYSYHLSGLDETTALYHMHSNSLNLALYATIDIGIHYDGWTLEELQSFLKNYGITDQATVVAIQTAILEAPGNYLKYYIGYLEFLELKEKAQSMFSTKHKSDLKVFHTIVLKIGAAPFPIIEKYLDDYYTFLYSSK